MISRKLQEKFYLLEMAAFPAWRAAGPKERDKIVKKLAKWQADEIIKEINNETRTKI